MKINFVTFSCNLTGGNRVVMELMNGLSNRGHEVVLVTFGTPEDLVWIKLQGRVIHLVRTLPERIVGFFYRKVFGEHNFPEEETRKIISNLPRADVNIATISYSGFAVHRSPYGMPFHYFMHYEPLVREEGYKQKIMEENYYLPTRKIVNSTWLANTIKQKTGQEIVGFTFPALNHLVFNSKDERVAVDSKKKITVVSLAKYKWWKGFPDALKAIEIVRKAGYDVEFLAFGGAFDKEKLPKEVFHIPFTFVGSKIDGNLADFYRSADILISASYFESFPLPPLEAMACGTPVVTTRYGTEDYALDHETALVVEPQKPELLAARIIELIENPDLYRKLSKTGIEKAKEFTWEAAALQLETILIKELQKKKE